MPTEKLKKFLTDNIKLTNEESEFFISRGQAQSIKKKMFIVQEGRIALFKAFLMAGCVRVFYTDSNVKENILYFGFEGAWLGDIESYHLHKPSRVSIQAIEDCEILFFTKNTFNDLSKKIKQLERWYEFSAVKMYSQMFDKLIESKIRNVEDKYLYLLKEHPEIFQRIPLQYIADYLEIAPQSLSRLRRRLLKK